MNPHRWHPCHARVLMLGSISVELQRFQLVVQDGQKLEVLAFARSTEWGVDPASVVSDFRFRYHQAGEKEIIFPQIDMSTILRRGSGIGADVRARSG